MGQFLYKFKFFLPRQEGICKTNTHTHTHTHAHIYIYIVLFGPVKPELGVIPSGQENHSGAEHFYLSIGSEEVLLYFSLCFWFTPETEKQDGNKFIILN